MGKPTGFLEFTRELPQKRDVATRVHDYKEIEQPFSEEITQKQAARCMDCGTPFCHSGCPLGNIIPEFNDAVYEQNWEYAWEILSSTNNFPEFTGRICPAPCESACVLGINKPPVAIEFIEKSIAEIAFKNGYVTPQPPLKRTGKTVAVVGSGPAGLAAAAQLNKAGHSVTVFERADQIGGLLRYGIPDFKLEKWTIDRRLAVMEAEGIVFRTGVHVGVDLKAKTLLADFDLVMLTGGSTVPRDLPIPGRELTGIYPAMEFLSQQNKRNASRAIAVDHQGVSYANGELLATGKHVIVIGGGDTGSDCVGTSNRQGAASVTQIELMPMPPTQRADTTPWPHWPMMLRTSTSHEEGCNRQWSINTKAFIGNEAGELVALRLVDLEWKQEADLARPDLARPDLARPGRMQMVEVPGSERDVPCRLALLAAGFLHPEQTGLLASLNLECDERGNVKTVNYQTVSNPAVFAAGDMRRGQSLVVWAISEGREAARAADTYLRGQALGESMLEAKAVSLLATA